MKITCDCGKIHEVTRTPEIPKDVISMGCNWCPDCEDTASEPYDEWYNRNDSDEGEAPPEPTPDNQLCMPFEMDMITAPKGINLHVETMPIS